MKFKCFLVCIFPLFIRRYRTSLTAHVPSWRSFSFRLVVSVSFDCSLTSPSSLLLCAFSSPCLVPSLSFLLFFPVFFIIPSRSPFSFFPNVLTRLPSSYFPPLPFTFFLFFSSTSLSSSHFLSYFFSSPSLSLILYHAHPFSPRPPPFVVVLFFPPPPPSSSPFSVPNLCPLFPYFHFPSTSLHFSSSHLPFSPIPSSSSVLSYSCSSSFPLSPPHCSFPT